MQRPPQRPLPNTQNSNPANAPRPRGPMPGQPGQPLNPNQGQMQQRPSFRRPASPNQPRPIERAPMRPSQFNQGQSRPVQLPMTQRPMRPQPNQMPPMSQPPQFNSQFNQPPSNPQFTQPPSNQPPQFNQPLNRPPLVNQPTPQPSPYYGTQQQLPSPQQQRKIDPSQVPSPIQVEQLDQRDEFICTFDPNQQSSINPVNPDRSSAIPLTSTSCHYIDNGNCTPRYIRATTSIPSTNELREASQIPLGLILQPLCDPNYDEDVPVVNSSSIGPIRCQQCRAYMCPRMSFTNGGKQFTCNFCNTTNTCPNEYFCNLDMNHIRMDINDHPELTLGTVDVATTKEYHMLDPKPLCSVFCLEQTANSLKNGLFTSTCISLLSILYNINPPVLQNCSKDLKLGNKNAGLLSSDEGIAGDSNYQFPLNSKLVLCTFNDILTLYTPSQTIVIADIDEPFNPVDCMLCPVNDKEFIIATLNRLIETDPTTVSNKSCSTSALLLSTHLLSDRGGKCILFMSQLPTCGLLTVGKDIILEVDKVNKQLQPTDETIQLTKSLIKQSVCVDIFACPSQFMDIVNYGSICLKTGGQLICHTRFNFDLVWIYSQLYRNLTKPFGYNGYLRVRTSAGMQVMSYMGALHTDDDVEAICCGIDADKSVGVLLQHTQALAKPVNVQCALLYTTPSGQRLVRINTLQIPLATELSNLFKMADVETIIALMGKYAILNLQQQHLKQCRELLMEKQSKQLAMYRKHCASNSPAGQLILPESLKVMPIYTLGILKRFLSLIQCPLDIKVNLYRHLYTLSTPLLMVHLYCRCWDLSFESVSDKVGQFEPKLILPNRHRSLMPTSSILIENGQCIYLYLVNTTKEWLQQLFNVSSIDQIPMEQQYLIELNTPLNRGVHVLIGSIYAKYRTILPIYIVRQGADPLEMDILQSLIEEKHADGPAYVDYLISSHRIVQQEVFINLHS